MFRVNMYTHQRTAAFGKQNGGKQNGTQNLQHPDFKSMLIGLPRVHRFGKRLSLKMQRNITITNYSITGNYDDNVTTVKV